MTQPKKPKRIRGVAFSGKGYGRLRLHLFTHARYHIEQCINHNYHCEAIAVIESVITDRLESRLSYILGQEVGSKEVGFETLGRLIQSLRKKETDEELCSLLDTLDVWREKRNKAIHELVKIEEGKPHKRWEQRLQELQTTSREGYKILKQIYHRVAVLNPQLKDFTSPFPKSSAPNEHVEE